MSYVVDWMAAADCSEETQNPSACGLMGARSAQDDRVRESQNPRAAAASEASVGHPEEEGRADEVNHYERQEDWERERERRIYRARAVGMLRRYMRYSIETGRLPSLLGREFFRTQVTSYTVVTFEDRVIFVHDMERCLEKMDEFSRQVLARIVLQEYEHEDAARLLGCTRMTVHRKLIEALDRLVGILLEVRLLIPLETNSKYSCQGGKRVDLFLSDCEDEK